MSSHWRTHRTPKCNAKAHRHRTTIHMRTSNSRTSKWTSRTSHGHTQEKPCQGELVPEIDVGDNGEQQGEVTFAPIPTPSETSQVHINANRTIPIVPGVNIVNVKGVKSMTGIFVPGKKSDLPQWIETFEWACESNDLSDAHKASVVGALLGEGASRVYRDIPDAAK